MANPNELKLKIKSQWANFNFFDWSLNFLLEKNRLVMLVISLAILSFCAYLWYGYLYAPEWSGAKKQEYIESRKEENVIFDEKSFNKIILEIKNRKDYFQKPVENVPDIFSLE